MALFATFLEIEIMRKNKAPVQSYENFCKAFAGVFKKHAYRTGTYHTCYVRGAIDSYCTANSTRRHYLMEDACAEDSCGYRVARALILQGWDEGTIVAHSGEQQRIVDSVGDFCFVDVLTWAGYRNEAGFHRDANGQRYAWLMDGAPALDEYTQDPGSDD